MSDRTNTPTATLAYLRDMRAQSAHLIGLFRVTRNRDNTASLIHGPGITGPTFWHDHTEAIIIAHMLHEAYQAGRHNGQRQEQRRRPHLPGM